MITAREGTVASRFGVLQIMVLRNEDLHGNAPDKSDTALILIDVINDLEFPEGEELLQLALPMAQKLTDLKQRARQASVPVIYVNDNFGRWRSDFQAQVKHCLADDVIGRPLVELLRPDEDDYFVLKPKHSGFYATMLSTLLQYLGVSRVILTGIATDSCVLFTANDAYMRDFELFVPRDCCAASAVEDHELALKQIERLLKGDTRPSTEIRFGKTT